MNAQTSKRIIRQMAIEAGKIHRRTNYVYGDTLFTVLNDRYLALKFALNCINKRIPKPVYDYEKSCIGIIGKCPDCGKRTLYQQKYCLKCGQALEWECEDDR